MEYWKISDSESNLALKDTKIDESKENETMKVRKKFFASTHHILMFLRKEDTLLVICGFTSAAFQH